jgi:hypothetical protein
LHIQFSCKRTFYISAKYRKIIQLSGFSGHFCFPIVVRVPLMDMIYALSFFHLAYEQKFGSRTDHVLFIFHIHDLCRYCMYLEWLRSQIIIGSRNNFLLTVACGGEFSTSSGIISSPYHPANYPAHRSATSFQLIFYLLTAKYSISSFFSKELLTASTVMLMLCKQLLNEINEGTNWRSFLHDMPTCRVAKCFFI